MKECTAKSTKMKPKVNPQIRALIASRDLQNIKLAFELAEAANCPYLKAFKKKYFGRKNYSTHYRNKIKLKSLLELYTNKSFKFSRYLLRELLFEFDMDIYENIVPNNVYYPLFNNFVNERINSGLTIEQWAVHKMLKDLKQKIQDKKQSDAEIPF